MIKVKKEGVLLSKTDLEFENEGVLNPAAIRIGNEVHLFYRAVQAGNHSTIGYCRLNGPTRIVERTEHPVIVPEADYESRGVEDPRIVQIDDTYYLTYTAYDGLNARGALATSRDLKNFTKHGIIVPQMTYAEFVYRAETSGKVHKKYYQNQKFYLEKFDPEKKLMLWDKNVIFFPRRIKGKLVFLHRIRPGIQIVYVHELKDLTPDFWKGYFKDFQDHILIDPSLAHEKSYVGGGCPPIETEKGWLLIYHGAEETDHGIVYSACAAALLDLENPAKVIARLPYALFAPEFLSERRGEVNNVVFPTGTALFDDTLYIYYGAADSCIATASVSLSALVNELLTYSIENEQQR
jgi:beta-1,2-mannobiose phosphorylase / 1,2-beta-oligomannan phosphorylase